LVFRVLPRYWTISNLYSFCVVMRPDCHQVRQQYRSRPITMSTLLKCIREFCIEAPPFSLQYFGLNIITDMPGMLCNTLTECLFSSKKAEDLILDSSKYPFPLWQSPPKGLWQYYPLKSLSILTKSTPQHIQLPAIRIYYRTR